ncbi:MAG: 2OG-Fe(II) oxygenase, partial [Vulcanococcus sp.]
MELIARYSNAGFEAIADGVMGFFERRTDLQRPGVAFGPEGGGEPAKVSTDISLVAIDRSDPEAFALAEVILRGVSAGLERYLQERPLFRDCCPDQQLFVNPIFNLQRYAPGEGFKRW